MFVVATSKSSHNFSYFFPRLEVFADSGVRGAVYSLFRFVILNSSDGTRFRSETEAFCCLRL